MVRFSVKGTTWITDDFIRCASLHGDGSIENIQKEQC